MKLVTIVGARPQFIKAAPVSRVLQDAGYCEYLVHTGQHYDYEMSQIFFEELEIPVPDINLQVGSGPHGWQTGQMLIGIEEILLREKPDLVLVYGDTNSTLAGALASVKLHIPLAHVEAGLRSFNRTMPEEHNRVLTDHCADLLFCPTQTAVDNLANEGITNGVHLVGDTMYDAVLQFSGLASERSSVLEALNLKPKQYLLTTLHRPYNTDVPENLTNILEALTAMDELVIFSVHPRTRQSIQALYGVDCIENPPNLQMINPVGYLDMLSLEKNARIILTDSGGIQKEAYFCGVPCITLRPETEWMETLEAGWNQLVEADRSAIIKAVEEIQIPSFQPLLFGDGCAATAIVRALKKSQLASTLLKSRSGDSKY